VNVGSAAPQTIKERRDTHLLLVVVWFQRVQEQLEQSNTDAFNRICPGGEQL